MNDFIPHQFEKLKTEMLHVYGIKQIMPSDCKRLSADIFSKTHKQVSETTLKRVFGFAYAQFKPSVFTISAIAEYCGYSGWKNFSDQFHITNKKPAQQNPGWDTIISHAKKVTGFTLQSLKNRSGIPFGQTIPRRFINEQLEIFAKEPYSGTILSAPAGYGKTTALCHWVDERVNGMEESDDVILFFNCNILISSTTGHNLNDWLLMLLGVNADHESLNPGVFEQGPAKGNFYLIVDGLNDCNYKNNEFNQLFGQLTDIVSLYRRYPWFKVILAMRATTWINHRHFLANKMNSWFLGFMNNGQQFINVPFFDEQEIAELGKLLNPAERVLITDKHISNLAYPFYFQYYYSLNSEDFSLNNINRFTMYDLTGIYVMNKVYKGKYNDDKVVLLKALTSHITFDDHSYSIDMLKVHDILKNHTKAFQELLSNGFLRVVNNSNNLKYQSNIMFNNNNILEYAVAEKLITDNNYEFNDRLIMRINEMLYNSRHLIPVIKWCIYTMVAGNYNNGLKGLAYGQLSTSEKSDLILFTNQLTEKHKQDKARESDDSLSE